MPCIGKYYPVAPQPNDKANKPPKGKVTVYTKLLEASNFRLPANSFMVEAALYFGRAFFRFTSYELHLTWLDKKKEFKVSKQCLVQFSIS